MCFWGLGFVAWLSGEPFIGPSLVASGLASIYLTSAWMIAAEPIHEPACATTLIVALGRLPTPLQVGIVVASVVLLVGFHRGVLVFADGLRSPDGSALSR